MSQLDQMQGAIVGSPFGALLGMRALEARTDYVRVGMPFSSERTTVGDTVHGGAIAALLDTAATAAAWSGVESPAEHRGTTIGFSVSFLAGARGADLEAEARVVRRGRSVCFIEVSIRDPDGQLVASGLVHYKLSRSVGG